MMHLDKWLMRFDNQNAHNVSSENNPHKHGLDSHL